MKLSPRAMGFAVTVLSLLSSAIYNIAITRKITLDDLGLLNIINSAVAFSSLPVTIPSFTATRAVAKDGSMDLWAAIKMISIFYAASVVMSIIYLLPLWGESGPYASLLLIITLLTAFTSYVQSITGSILLVKDRSSYVFAGLVSSIAKILIIPLIMFLHWSIIAVLWSTFLIVASSSAYSLAKAAKFHKPLRNFKYMLKWSMSASWVSMMGSIADTVSSLSTEVIGVLGSLVDLGVWNVLRAIGRLFTMPNVIPSIMYGELLERNRLDIVYRDMLVSLFINTSIMLTVATFEPLIIDLLRPNDLNLIGPLYLPILLFLVANTMSMVNGFTDNLISGVDKADLENEISFHTYWGSHIGFSKLLHLVRASLYIILAVPIYFLIRSLPFAIVMAFSVSNIIAFSTSFSLRLDRIRRMRIDFPVSNLWRDYVAPALVSVALIYATSYYVRFKLVHDVYITITEIIVAFVIVTSIYLTVTLLMSPRSRAIFKAVLRSLRQSMIVDGQRRP